MSKDVTKIAKIVLNIAGKEIELSPKQAKELRDILAEMYPGTKTSEYHYHYPRPYTPYTWPYATWTVSSKNAVLLSDSATRASSNVSNMSTDTVYLAASNS